MDPGNVREALREAALDVEEGADFLMVKPALAYLDVIRRVHDAYPELPMGRVQRERRILDGEGGGRARLARRALESRSRTSPRSSAPAPI